MNWKQHDEQETQSTLPGFNKRSLSQGRTDKAWWGPLDGPRTGRTEPNDLSEGTLPFAVGFETLGSARRNAVVSTGTLLTEQHAIASTADITHTGKETDKPHISTLDISQIPPTSQHSIVEMTRRLDEVRSAIADRDKQIAECRSADRLGGEVASLRANIRRAIADKQSLVEEARQRTAEVQRLEEAIRRTDTRVHELEERLLAPTAGSTASCGAVGAASISDSSLSTEEIPDGHSTWHECIAALEGEIRRKSQLALDLHHRVHQLESQLRQQMQSNDEKIECTQKSLKFVLEQLNAYSASGGCGIP